MTSVIDGVDQRTQLVGRNRLELLLFRLGDAQRFGINVFKVREVVKCPPLTRIPQSHHVVRGVAHMRGNTITVIDLSLAVGRSPIADTDEAFVVVTEFNRQVQGFLVSGVERIVNMNWEDILPPPKGTGDQNYMTAVTNVDDELVEIIDVEKVLAEVTGVCADVSDGLRGSAAGTEEGAPPPRVFVVDDSSVARKQITRTLDQLGLQYETAGNGREALERLQALVEQEGVDPAQRFAAVISDVEMPEMDGYTLTKHIKSDPRLKGLWVLLHTSLSGVFNRNMVQKVGADEFVPKFNAEELGTCVLRRMQGIAEGGAGSAGKAA
jgi:two-component system, chemotaxis family, chemotaxis protein CheV